MMKHVAYRAGIIIGLSGLIACAIAVSNPRTVNEGVYTEAQAKVGERLYAQHCLLCHDKKYYRRVLKGFEGQQLDILFTVMSTSMPEGNPGYLTEKESVDILAYALSLSRYAPGDTELDYQNGALSEITVAPRQRAN